MKDFFSWYKKIENDKPWLIIGKGPSFSKIQNHDITHYRTLALNHAIMEVCADVCHVIDLDVLEIIGEELLASNTILLMPFHPHVENRAGMATLEELLSSSRILKALSSDNRLLWYNSSTSKHRHSGSPIVPVKYFSADAAVSLLTMAGESLIWSAGIDGGARYSQSFSDLEDKTLLSNGRESFDIQFIAIALELEKYQAQLIPLEEETIKVFVGTTEDQWLATRILEHSIRINTSASVNLSPLYESNIEIPLPKKSTNRPRTPFSFQRFLIPRLCNFEGKAIYLDSDMQVFTDIRGLAHREMGDQQIMNAWQRNESQRKPQFSVMLLNCEKLLHWDVNKIVTMLDDDEITYEELMHDMKLATFEGKQLEAEWNSLEAYEHDKTKLLHYTDMETQPWLSRKNPFASIWITELFEAIQHQFVSMSDLKREVFLGNIRPTLIFQIRTRTADPKDIPVYASWLDLFFIPPHRQKKWHQKNKLIKHVKAICSYNLARFFAKFN